MSKITVTVDFGWWTHNRVYRYWVKMLYTWNLYNVTNQCYLNTFIFLKKIRCSLGLWKTHQAQTGHPWASGKPAQGLTVHVVARVPGSCGALCRASWNTEKSKSVIETKNSFTHNMFSKVWDTQCKIFIPNVLWAFGYAVSPINWILGIKKIHFFIQREYSIYLLSLVAGSKTKS